MGVAEAGPLARIRRSGLAQASVVDLLAVAGSRTEADVEASLAEAAGRFRAWTLPQYKDLAPADLAEAFGLEGFEALRLLAALELGRRSGAAAQGERRHEVRDGQDAYALFRHLADESQEHFAAAYFDAKARHLGTKTVHVGTLTASIVGAREVFREAVRLGAASVIVAHNHPSGDPTPSPEDVEVTRHLAEAGRLLDIALLDHIVVGHNGAYRSLHQAGAL
jgi:DNA repair protein RadC